MKKIYFTICYLLISFLGYAQVMQPVTWKFSVNPIDDKTIEIVAQGTMQEGWHAYALELPDGGPIPTSITIKENNLFTLDGKPFERPKPEIHDDATFGMKVGYVVNNGKIIQKLKLKSNSTVTIEGALEFMACNDESCLPPDNIEFSLKYEPKSVKKETETAVVISTTKDSAEEKSASLAIPLIAPTNNSSTNSIDTIAKSENAPIVNTTESTTNQSNWTIFWLAFGGGLLALLTPCVFPMIPMTVSFFTKQSKSRASGIKNGAIYALSIVVIYVILGVVVTSVFGADSLNALSTNPWFNLFFAVLLIVFAASFFGAFEIVLPSSWVNAADKNADRGGLIGIFFMASTLALVSFSCTGPIVGSLIVQAAREGGLAPIIGMLGFSLAIALPFAFFAAFPGYLNSLPKSGSWLNSVKVVLGFLELAFAFKFLSIADMVLDLHLLERELFIAIWITIALALGFYLLGRIRLPHDSPMEKVPVSRFLLALVTFSFAVYLTPGLWGAPVNLISGFPPPKEYSESPFGLGNSIPSSSANGNASNNHQLISGMHHGPQGIPAFDDYETALNYARKVKKPLLIDFTGKGCVNCRKMEDLVWGNSEVKSMISNDYVLVSLYVDLRIDLPIEDQYVSPTTGKKIITVGNKWSDFQIARYNRNSQPHYVIVDANEKELVPSKAYDPNTPEYINWLKLGISEYKKDL